MVSDSEMSTAGVCAYRGDKSPYHQLSGMAVYFCSGVYKNLISRWKPTTATITIMMTMLTAITMATMEMVIGMVDDGSGSCKF